jgi:hypothetical protein
MLISQSLMPELVPYSFELKRAFRESNSSLDHQHQHQPHTTPHHTTAPHHVNQFPCSHGIGNASLSTLQTLNSSEPHTPPRIVGAPTQQPASNRIASHRITYIANRTTPNLQHVLQLRIKHTQTGRRRWSHPVRHRRLQQQPTTDQAALWRRKHTDRQRRWQ